MAVALACAKCGQEHQHCKAHNRQGLPCGQTPMSGQGTCHLHGGKAPLGIAKAAREALEAKVRSTLYREGIEPVGDVLEAFRATVGETLAFKKRLESMVADLGEANWRFTDDRGGEQLRSEVALYRDALAAAGKLLVDWQRMGMEQRLVQLEESKVALVVAAFLASLEEVGVSEEVAGRMREVFARRLSS